MNIVTINTEYGVSYPVFSNQKNLRDNCNAIAEELGKIYQDNIFCLICTGTSGLSMATLVAAKLPNAKVVYIRKESERKSSHSDTGAESDIDFTSGEYPLVLIDDFVATGATFRRMLRQLQMGYADVADDSLVYYPNLKIDTFATAGNQSPEYIEEYIFRYYKMPVLHNIPLPKNFISRYKR